MQRRSPARQRYRFDPLRLKGRSRGRAIPLRVLRASARINIQPMAAAI